jgi:hypothetical protein
MTMKGWSYEDKMQVLEGVYDMNTVTTMSLTIYYTYDFANSLGLFGKWGVQLVASFIMKVCI